MKTIQQRLTKHLMATDGNLGRTGRAVTMLAEASGVSVAMLQSVARGSRKFSDSTADKVAIALYKQELRWAPVIRSRRRG